MIYLLAASLLLSLVFCTRIYWQNIKCQKSVEELRAENSRLVRIQDEFLANMSHELRTPVTSLRGFTDLLLEWIEEDRLPYRYTEAAQIMKRNELFLLDVINSILTFQKLKSGMPVASTKESKPVRELLEEVVSSLRLLAEEKRIGLLTEIDDTVPVAVLIDALSFRQVAFNLIQNAIKFTSAGEVRAKLSYQTGDSKEAGNLLFEVRDTGAGIEKENLEKIFTPFFQAESASARNYGGVGLGLAICKALVDKAGGAIRVESRRGVGSRFLLTLPAPICEVQKPVVLKVPKEAAFHTVVLAEDSPDSQLVIQKFLKKLCSDAITVCTVCTVCNGREAVQAVLDLEKSHKPLEAVLMDMQMPVMDGYQATRLLRQRGFAKPIIAITAHNLPGDREKCLSAGCTDYLAKPINADAFLKTIGGYLRV